MAPKRIISDKAIAELKAKANNPFKALIRRRAKVLRKKGLYLEAVNELKKIGE